MQRIYICMSALPFIDQLIHSVILRLFFISSCHDFISSHLHLSHHVLFLRLTTSIFHCFCTPQTFLQAIVHVRNFRTGMAGPCLVCKKRERGTVRVRFLLVLQYVVGVNSSYTSSCLMSLSRCSSKEDAATSQKKCKKYKQPVEGKQY